MFTFFGFTQFFFFVFTRARRDNPPIFSLLPPIFLSANNFLLATINLYNNNNSNAAFCNSPKPTTAKLYGNSSIIPLLI